MIERGYGVVGAQIPPANSVEQAPVVQRRLSEIEAAVLDIDAVVRDIGASLENLHGPFIPPGECAARDLEPSIEGRLEFVRGSLHELNATLVAYRTFLREHIG